MAVQTQGKTGGQPEAVVPGMPFDSNIAGCVWHRLLVDAQIPAGSAISVRARAADDALLLQVGSWQQQPTLYLRSGGAELPYYDPWHDIQPPPEGAGLGARYSDEHLLCLRAIPVLRNRGLRLDEIRERLVPFRRQ